MLLGVLYFKTTDIHPGHLDRKLSPEPPTTAPSTENVSGLTHHNTSSRQSRLALLTSSMNPGTGRWIQGKGLKILIPKQLLQRLPILLAQVHAGITFEGLLNKIRQIVYLLVVPGKKNKNLKADIQQFNEKPLCKIAAHCDSDHHGFS